MSSTRVLHIPMRTTVLVPHSYPYIPILVQKSSAACTNERRTALPRGRYVNAVARAQQVCFMSGPNIVGSTCDAYVVADYSCIIWSSLREHTLHHTSDESARPFDLHWHERYGSRKSEAATRGKVTLVAAATWPLLWQRFARYSGNHDLEYYI